MKGGDNLYRACMGVNFIGVRFRGKSTLPGFIPHKRVESLASFDATQSAHSLATGNRVVAGTLTGQVHFLTLRNSQLP